MRAGKLNHRIVIQQSTPGKDSFGEMVEAWSTYVERWAEKTTMQGSERYLAQQRYAEATTFFRIRHGSSITPQMRVTENGTIFRIHGVQDMEGLGREWVLFCSELV